MTNDTSFVAAIVVHYDSPVTLKKTLENLNLTFDKKQIIVVDNSSSLTGEDFHRLATIIDDGENRGYAGGVNRGFRFVSAHLPAVSEVLICTHETIFRPGAIARLLSTAAEYPNGHIVGPRLVTQADDGSYRVWSNGGSLRPPLFYPKHDTNSSLCGTRQVDWIDGAAFVIDKDSFARIGGFPEEFFMYMEDVAMGLLLRKMGIPVLVDVAATVEQTANGPSRSLAIRNRTLLALRYMGPISRQVVYFEIRFRQIIMSLSRSSTIKNKAAESREAARTARALAKALARSMPTEHGDLRLPEFANRDRE